MPHVIAQVEPGTSEDQKKQLAKEFTKAIATELKVPEANISVGVEEVSSEAPKVIINLWPGRTADQKSLLLKDFTEAVTKTLGIKTDSDTIKFNEIDPKKWIAEIYDPEIVGKKRTLYKKPEYDRKIYNSWIS